MAPERRRGARALRAVALVLVVAATAHFARHLDVRAVGRALAHASPALLVAAVLLNVAQVLPRSVTWSILLGANPRVSPRRIVRHHAVSLAVSNVLSARVGDVARVYLLREHEAVPVAASVTATVVEKGIASVVHVLFTLPLFWLLPSLPRWSRWAVGAVGAIGVGALAAVALSPAVLRRVPRLASFVEAARAACAPRALAAATLLIALEWALGGAAAVLVSVALGGPASWAVAPLVQFFINVAVAVPSTPAQLGAYEMGASAALHLAGAGRETAVAYALLLHVVDAVPVTLLGLALGGLRLVVRRDLRAA